MLCIITMFANGGPVTPRPMLLPWSLILLVHTVLAVRPAQRFYDTHDYYVLHHDPQTGVGLADAAHALGVELVEQVGELQDHWLVRVEKPITPKILEGREGRDRVLERHATLRARSTDDDEARIGASIKYLSRQSLRQRVKRVPVHRQQDDQADGARAVAQRLGIDDPLFTDQWHIINDEAPVHSMNIVPVWEMGFTGKGVISSFIDDGLDYTSEDLKDNFVAEFSHDYNDHEDLPTPKLGDDTHGTRCAGQVGAIKNKACGIGIAYDSKVAAVRILSGAISDADEAAALNFGFQNVSIYSCSWGPPDNGAVMEGPDYLINKAVLNGINHGRGGKGSVFVFAAGNGAASSDTCNHDGYTNSIYSVTVAAVDHKGLRPYYSEACTANLVAAYSSGSGKAITTTDKGKNKCTSSHGGTSAAAPNAVGVFALALEARPDLTWRDIQHLCVDTARQIDKGDSWELTAAGRNYSSIFGYGALDATAFVQAAQKWKLVKPQTRMHTRTVQIEQGTMNPMGNYSGGEVIGVGGVTSVMNIKYDMVQDANLEKLEHITVRVWIDHTRRGDVRVELRSPMVSMDSASTGFPGWTMMTVKHWIPVGDWMITVSDLANAEHRGKFLGWDMVFWGSTIDPKKAVLYELTHADPLLPPNDEPSFGKPTDYLTQTEGATTTVSSQMTHSAAPSGASDVLEDTSKTETTTSLPSPSASDAASSQLARIIETLKSRLALSLFALFVLSFTTGMLMWRYCYQQHADREGEERYISLPLDGTAPMSMSSDRTRPVVAGDDSDDEADERTGLNSGPYQHVAFHSGFLDDDEEHEYPPRASSPAYRDEEERRP
ncbi:peptidase S8/S53 domain-containing protein [Mycena amicta]|nr:peptidase S8/S53 domain-containing protein [Mycena amicta]